MKVLFHKHFDKHYQRLPKKIQTKFDERLVLLLSDESSPLLNVHELKGALEPLVSMNVTGDYRALFIRSKNCIEFQEIGTHSELY